MTKELAIRILTGDVLGTSEQTQEAIKMAVRALSQPKPRSFSCGHEDDLISRKAAIDTARDWYEGLICGSVKGLEKRLRALPSAQPEQRWILCADGNEPKANADCWISTNAKYVRRASYAPKANNQPNGFIVTEGGFGFYEYGKSAKAWMPYEEPEPFREEGDE